MRLLSILLIAAGLVAAQIPQASREQALGRMLSKDIESRERFMDDAQVIDYVTAVANKLTPACSASGVSVRVMQSEELNASAVPGGQLYVTSALLRFVETESELAGILAHLMKRTLVPGGTTTNANAQFITSPNGDQFLLTPDTVVPRGLQNTVMSAIAAADGSAMQCMDRAGYDPVGLIMVLQRMPSVPVERMEHVSETIMMLEPSRAFLLNTTKFFEVRRHLAAITPVQRPASLRQ